MKKKDFILIVVLLLIAALSWGGMELMRRRSRLPGKESVVPVQTENKGETTLNPETAEETKAEQKTENPEARQEESESVVTTEESVYKTEESTGKQTAEDSKDAVYIRITAAGELIGEYSLAEDRTIPIGETNVCVIENGKARMSEAKCPDQLCMYMLPIENVYDFIICLPNAVVIEGIPGPENTSVPEIDGIS